MTAINRFDKLTTTNTTDASSSTTGAVTHAGGMGIAKKLYVGSTTDASSASTGSIVTAGGAGIAKKLFVGTSVSVASGGYLYPQNGKSLDSSSAAGLSVADNATSALFATGAGARGILVLYEKDATGAFGVFAVGLSVTALIKSISSAGIAFTDTVGTASAFNVYVTGGNVTIQNKSGGLAGIQWQFIATG